MPLVENLLCFSVFVSGDEGGFEMWIIYGIGIGAAVLSLIGFLVYYNRVDLCGYSEDEADSVES